MAADLRPRQITDANDFVVVVVLLLFLFVCCCCLGGGLFVCLFVVFRIKWRLLLIVLNSGFREQVLSVCDTDPPTLLLSPSDIHVMHDRTKGGVRREKVSTCTVPPGDKCRPALCLGGTSVDLHQGKKCRPALEVLRGKGESVPVSFDFP